MRIYSRLFWFTVLPAALVMNSCKKEGRAAPPLSGGSTLDKEVYLDSISGSVSTLFYTYNPAGDLILISSAAGANGGDTLIYSKPGKLLKYKAGGAWESTLVYDSLDRVSGAVFLAAGQTVPDTGTVYSYDGMGRVIADSSYYGQDRVMQYHAYSYDNNNNIVAYQRFNRFATDTFLAEGLTTVLYDHHPNPHFKFGKWVYFSTGDYRYLFKENSISEKLGPYEEKNPPDPRYEYYADGLLWKTGYPSNHSSITYYYKP